MNRVEARRRATELVDRMTVEEMASQLRFDAPAIERLGVPEYNWWNEGLHGVARAGTATVFPQAIGLGATFDVELLYEVGNCISTEARAKYNEAVKHGDRDIYKGLTMWSPNVNLFRDPRWGRGQETYGEDPYLIAELAIPFIKGLQGDKEYMKIAACAKHFAVHSGPEALRHSFDAKAEMKDMWETYLPAFEACVKEAKVEAVMGAYNRTNGEPCCAHSYLMDDVLRGQWGFEGHYVSDCWAVRDFHENHKITNAPEESVKLALEHGCDVNCGCTYQRILNAYEAGMISKETIRASAIRLFTTRFLLGMFDKTEYDEIPFEVVDCREHQKLAEKAACESVVLLKNDGILPLDKSKLKTIGVIGPNADSRKALKGNYHGTSSRYITVLQGIQDICKEDVRVLYAKGCNLYKAKEENLAREDDRLQEAVTVAEHSDVVILCLGLNETLEGEEGDTGNSYASGDKENLMFPAPQRRLLAAVAATGKPIIFCSMTGSAMDLEEATSASNAVLQTWYPGARGGGQVAKILFGDAYPSGKLPVTFYHERNVLPKFTDYSMKGRTYRYITEQPMYPFGYGLNYGNAEVISAKVLGGDVLLLGEGQELALEVEVTNTGKYTADEVLQIYVKVAGTVYEVPNGKLGAFKRISIEPNETKKVAITVPAKAFVVVNEEGQRIFDGTEVSLSVGFSQPDERSCELMGRKPVQLTVPFVK